MPFEPMLNDVGVKLPPMLQISNTSTECKVGDNSNIVRLHITAHHFAEKPRSPFCIIRQSKTSYHCIPRHQAWTPPHLEQHESTLHILTPGIHRDHRIAHALDS